VCAAEASIDRSPGILEAFNKCFFTRTWIRPKSQAMGGSVRPPAKPLGPGANQSEKQKHPVKIPTRERTGFPGCGFVLTAARDLQHDVGAFLKRFNFVESWGQKASPSVVIFVGPLGGSFTPDRGRPACAEPGAGPSRGVESCVLDSGQC
jgi:hypothetical protein